MRLATDLASFQTLSIESISALKASNVIRTQFILLPVLPIMTDSESSQELDIKLVVDDDDEPLAVSIQIFDKLKKALFSSQDQSRTVANELDSLLSTYLTCEQGQSQHRPNLYGFIAELVLILSQTAMQIPIQHEELHQKLAKVVIELSQLETVYEYEGREMSWHQLPFVEAEFEDQSHREFQRRGNGITSFAYNYMLKLKTSCSDE